MSVFTPSIEFTSDYPAIEPSLKLDFANARALDPRIAFKRDSVATYVGKDGLIKTAGWDEPRFDHDPVTGESLGLLIEEPRTNLFTYSDLTSGASGSWWLNGGPTVSTGSAVLAPDGTVSAWTTIYNGTSGDGNLYRGGGEVTTSNNTDYTYSVWAKVPSTNTYITGVRLRTFNDNHSANFNLLTGTIVGTAAGTTTNRIEAYPNGWYRCSITFTSGTDGDQGFQFYLISNTNSTSLNSSGANGEELYLWGAQLEEASFPTSYIPTSGTTATREVEYGYTTDMDFYNQSEGSVLSEVSLLDVGNTTGKVIWSLNQVGGFGEGIYLANENNGQNLSFNLFEGGSNQEQLGTANITTNQYYQTIHSFEKNNVDLSYDGVLVEGSTPDPTQGQAEYTTSGSYTWTAPSGVTSVCVVCVGGGGAGGGALAYRNNITVVPGTGYSVVVGAGGVATGPGLNTGTSGGDSSFSDGTNTTTAEGGVTGSETYSDPAGTYDGGGRGGYAENGGGYSGGGAGGYSGDGGITGFGASTSTDGQGGGGGGGAWAYWGGGGVGIYGEGANGSAGTADNSTDGPGKGGSGGGDGGYGTNGGNAVTGGLYGGGYGSRWNGNQGGGGAVRIIWGSSRSFPSTNTADVSSSIDLPTAVGRLVIGNNGWGSSTPSNNSNPGNCHIKSFSYYPKRLPDWQLKSLTGNPTEVPPPPSGQAEFTTPGSYTWTAPDRVTSVCVVCVGAGGQGQSYGGQGGSLAYKNNITVTPGQSYAIEVGETNMETDPNSPTTLVNKYAENSSAFGTVAYGGRGGNTNIGVHQGIGLNYDGGGIGGNGSTDAFFDGGYRFGSGGGAGGYSGVGGDASSNSASGGNGSGGGGGGGAAGPSSASGGGGGVGIYGEGTSGAGGTFSTDPGGKGGSGGTDGAVKTNSITGGGLYGGGGAGYGNVTNNGSGGAVRIIWGPGRSFPSTNTADV